MGSSTGSKRVLVVGLGIAGAATAIRLHRSGWTVTVVEKAPQRRGSGYFIVLFGAGRSAARRLGLLPRLHDRVSPGELATVDRDGRRSRGIAFGDLPDAPWVLLRGDVESAAAETMPADVGVRFSTVPTGIDQDADGVVVDLLDTATGVRSTERFDLVVGADGLRSTVRSLAFGPHERYLRRLDKMICAFRFRGTPPFLRPREGAALTEPGRGMWVFPFADHDPTVLFSWDTDDVDAEFTGDPVERIRAVFGPGPLGPVLEAGLRELAGAEEVLFDSAEQVHMDRWSRGRVVLVGDAAWCVTLYAGMGASSGLSGADLLGDALDRHPGDVDRALATWEETLRPYIEVYQRDGRVQGAMLDEKRPAVLAIRRVLGALVLAPVVGPFLRRVSGMQAVQATKDTGIVLPALVTTGGDGDRRVS